MRYIELNPVRAGMVDHPGAYRWSSYRCNAQGEADELIRPHAVFTALDADPRICGERHRGLFLNALEPGDVGRKRAGTNDSAALGDDRSAARLASVLSRREIVELGSDPYSPRRVLPRLSARHSLSGREIDDLVDILSI